MKTTMKMQTFEYAVKSGSIWKRNYVNKERSEYASESKILQNV